ncbi:putative diphthine methyl ester synthase [Tanacetum coccineum]
MWEWKKQGYAVGRIHQVPPSLGEAYYLRVLLNKVKGKTSWEEIRTVEGKLYYSFRDACFAMGLLDDDKEYIEAIKEGYRISFGDSVRRLFVMLLTNESSLSSISGMPLPDLEFLENHTNTLIHDKISYNPDLLRAEHERLFLRLTAEQKIIYTRVISAVENNKGGVFFLYGYGGTGKTYIWKTLSAAIRSKGEIVLNVASSGIAPLLLTGGRTAHSRFGIPINVNEYSFCSITAGTDLVALLIKTSLIIWDEAPMMHIHCFEVLDRYLRDIIGLTNPKAKEMPFGGKILKMGDGCLGGPNDGEATIDIPDDILISDNIDPIASLIKFVYPFLDSICESEGVNNTYTESLYSPEVLNGLKLSGIPNHRLSLKVGAPVMLLRNIDQMVGLCNGTRLRILKFGEHVIEAQIMTGTNVGHTTIIPHLKLSPSDKRLPLKINQRQFPLVVCFAMAINKIQGQSLSNVEFFLPNPVFTHGQLCIAMSQVKSKKGLKVLIYDKESKPSNNTLNVTKDLIHCTTK